MSYKIKRALPFLGLCISILVITACITHKSEPFGTVIILNGPSAVGKSSIIKAFQNKQDTPWLSMGIDNLFVGVVSMKFLIDPKYKVMQGFPTEDASGKLFTLHIGSEGQKIIRGMHRAIAAYARTGNNVIVDYITYDPTWIADLQSSLRGINTVYVGVTASLETIQQREKARGTSPEGHGRSLYESVHKEWKYDLKIDTDIITPDQVSDIITQYMEKKK
jgi:chloramphenicol 3-O phosphotransferase